MTTLTSIHAKCEPTNKRLREKQLIPIDKLKSAALKDGYDIEYVLNMQYKDIEGSIEDIFSKKKMYVTIRSSRFHINRWRRWALRVREENDIKVQRREDSLRRRDILLTDVLLSKKLKTI